MEQATHFLFPSTLFASREPHIISTILGSCVAVCLYDPVLKTGGMNHYMLPYWNGNGLASPKFGNIAIHKLLEKLLSNSSLHQNIIAKVFGGGNVLETNNMNFMIGDRNINIAYEILKDLNIKIVSQSVGGNNGRKIEFNTFTGEVRQKLIEKHFPAGTATPAEKFSCETVNNAK